MSEFCEPYATRVVTKLLGLPDAEWRHFADLAVSMGLALGVTFKEDLPRIEAALEELFKYADRIIAERKGKIGDDFLSTLINLEDGGDKLSEQELRDMIVLLIFGGIDTTRNQIGLALWKFMEHPNQWDKLGKAPELQAQAVEEVMRVRPTVTWVTREAVEDFTFRGLDIDKGTTIHLFSQAACSDPRIIKDNSFDIEAKGRPRHTGFGGGKHFCLGAFIARADMGEAVSILSQRLKNIQVNGEVEWFPDSGNTGPITLPIKFEKR